VVDDYHSLSQQIWKALQALQAAAETEFERQRRLHRNRFQCREGCDTCCRTPFAISEAEAASISQAIEALPPHLTIELRHRAAKYLRQRLAVFSKHGYRHSRGELAPGQEQLPCPALIDGRCVVYEHRPTLCRRFGAVLQDASETDRVFACQLNFSPGERIGDAHLAARQRELANLAVELNQRYYSAGGRRYGEPITVAHALLEDFRVYLPCSG